MNNLVDITSDYEYVLGNLQGNVLDLQAQFQSGTWTREELHIIAKELEQTGKLFAERQGLGMSYAVESINGAQFSIVNYHKTGTLINSIHAVVDGNYKINFFNDARNSRGQYYAGHIEYGFHDRSGKFIPARPFMRPALYAVSESSKGNILTAMGRLTNQVLFSGLGAGSFSNFSFGRKETASGGIRKFYQQSHLGRGAGQTGRYTSSKLFSLSKSGFSKFKGQNRLMSANRRTGNIKNFIGRDSRSRDGTRQRQTAFTKRFGHFTNRDRGRGRPYEGKASYLRRNTGNPRGRPKGSTKKSTSSTKSNPYNHGRIKRDIKPSSTAHLNRQKFDSSAEKVRDTGKANPDNKYGKAVKTPTRKSFSDFLGKGRRR